MQTRPLLDLATLIRQQRQSILERWRDRVSRLPSAVGLDGPTLDDHIPAVLDELASRLEAGSKPATTEALEMEVSPVHGVERFRHNFDIEEVVAEYSMLRDVIHDLAEENDLTLMGQPFLILNRVLDGAVGGAVNAFSTQRALDVQRQREDYLAFVAHDIRAPLNALSVAIAVLELVLPDASAGPETVRLLKTLKGNIERLDELAGQLVEEGKSVAAGEGVVADRRTFRLSPLVDALLHGFDPVGRAVDTALRNEVPEDLVVHADPRLLSRILQNLLTNAITYTPHGKVEIGARELDEQGSVECWVRDDGMGIPKDQLESVFEKARTDAQRKGGSGLGLAIVRSFVQAHGGRVEVESKEGEGSTFRFDLPGA